MMFSIFLSLFLIFAPQIARSPTSVSPSPENLVVSENVSDVTVKQSEGDAPQVGLPRAEPLSPRKKEGSMSLGIETTARAALVFDEGTGTILFDKNSEERLSLASLTKLMTTLVFLDGEVDWGKKVKLVKADDLEGGIFYARSPEEVTVKDLFNMMLVGSVNNAAMALARQTGQSQEEFVAEMNKKAEDLKLHNTIFADPTGLLSENQGTARDVAKLLDKVLKEEMVRDIVVQKTYVFSPVKSSKIYYVKSTDELLWSFLNEAPYKLIGGKTGYIEEAGYNLAVEVERDSHKIIVVVLGSSTAEDRFKEVKGLADWTFETYKW